MSKKCIIWLRFPILELVGGDALPRGFKGMHSTRLMILLHRAECPVEEPPLSEFSPLPSTGASVKPRVLGGLRPSVPVTLKSRGPAGPANLPMPSPVGFGCTRVESEVAFNTSFTQASSQFNALLREYSCKFWHGSLNYPRPRLYWRLACARVEVYCIGREVSQGALKTVHSPALDVEPHPRPRHE